MSQNEHYRLRIKNFTPENIPMSRLAEYMLRFATLLGERSSVHFEKIETGSAQVVARVEKPATHIVKERLEKATKGIGPAEVMRAVREIDDLLQADNSSGELTGPNKTNIIQFPGITRPIPPTYGPFKEQSFLDGQIIRIGGKGDTIPVHLLQGDRTHICSTSVELSKELSQYYREGIVRVFGIGKWFRTKDGTWQLQDFWIDDYEILDTKPLNETRKELQTAGPTGWADVVDPLTDLKNLRSED